MTPQARAHRMQMRADKADLSAAQARSCCEEKKEHLKHLLIELDTQQSDAVTEACNSPAEVSKRVDHVQLKGCSSPCERFAHQIDLFNGTRQVVDKLQKRIESLNKHHEKHSHSCTCKCIDCCEERMRKKQEVADTLRRAAVVAQKQTGGKQHGCRLSSSLGAVKARPSTRHLQSLQDAQKLREDVSCAPVEAEPMRRTTPWCFKPSRDAAEAKLPSLTGTRPRSASCVSRPSRRQYTSNEDF